VEVDNGWVTLTGEVIWAYQKDAAAEDVRRLFGVTGLSNQTTIKPHVNTTTISDDIVYALRRSWSYPKTVMVSTEGGDIRLTGTVPSLNDSKIETQPHAPYKVADGALMFGRALAQNSRHDDRTGDDGGKGVSRLLFLRCPVRRVHPVITARKGFKNVN
jgi:hypothetical protein